MKIKFTILLSLLILQSCSYLPDWLGAAEEPPLKGDRFSVMTTGSKLKPDASLDLAQVNLPPQAKDDSSKNIGNIYLQSDLSRSNSVNIGSSPDSYFVIRSQPRAYNDLIIAIDGSNTVSAYGAGNLSKQWEYQIETPEDKENLPGGGLEVYHGNVFVTTGFGKIISLSAASGKLVWEKQFSMPIRNAPELNDNKAFVTTNDNNLYALDSETGELIWQHSGVVETTKIYGTPSPAVKNNVLVAAYSSGELFGINAIKGAELWTELTSLGSDRTKASAGITDITASPLIVDGIVYITSHSGTFAAYNLLNGFNIWEKQIASGAKPWVAGDFIFTVTEDGDIIALNRFDGRIKWVTKLSYEEDENPVFSGPVIAGGSLIITDSLGNLTLLDPATGKTQRKVEIPEEIYTTPLISNGSLYLLSNNAELIQLN